MIAQDIIDAEIARQARMWGERCERTRADEGQLVDAAIAQLVAMHNKNCGNLDAFKEDGEVRSEIFPADWSGFRDYGSDIANIAVASAYLTREIDRLIREGADTTRTSRDLATQPFTGDIQPAVIEA